MLGVFIVPTGIGAEIGGHAGDATPAARLIASCCDRLIVHPNVVNASDINEMTPNMLYVDGAILDQFLAGALNLQPPENHVGGNRILLVANAPLEGDTLNAANAARSTIGADIQVVELNEPLTMTASITDGIATGEISGVESLVSQVENHDFDTLAIHTPIDVAPDVVMKYFREGGVNPWGGVEAKASRLISESLDCRVPVAHAPVDVQVPDELRNVHKMDIDPRMAAEAMSIGYLHCVLKGLHQAPLPMPCKTGIDRSGVGFMVSPVGCWGRPHKACARAGIPVILVRENRTVLNVEIPADDIHVVLWAENYLEATGLVMAMRAKVTPVSVRWVQA